MLRGEPHAVTIGFTGLCATGLAEIGLNASLPEGNQLLDVGTHRRSQANDQLEVRANSGAIGGFLHQLEIAKGVGDGAGFLVEIGGGKTTLASRAVSVRNMSWTTRNVLRRAAGFTP